jgi:hypothetical protein
MYEDDRLYETWKWLNRYERECNKKVKEYEVLNKASPVHTYKANTHEDIGEKQKERLSEDWTRII